MKLNIKYIIGVAAVATLGMVSCTDFWKRLRAAR